MDGTGDNADFDDDNDGWRDNKDDFPYDPTEYNDTDGDGIGNNIDDDIDGDGVINQDDDYPYDPFHQHKPSKSTDEFGYTESLLLTITILLIILILFMLLNFMGAKSMQFGKAAPTKETADERLSMEDKLKAKARARSEEKFRCSECGKIVRMSDSECPGCGLEFED